MMKFSKIFLMLSISILVLLYALYFIVCTIGAVDRHARDKSDYCKMHPELGMCRMHPE